MACLADEKAVGGQDSTVGIGDGEAKFPGAILRASRRGDEQEKKGGVDQDGVDRNTAQMESPKSAGDASGLFYSDGGRRLWDGSATTFGREGGLLYLYERPARMLPVRTSTFRNGDGAGDGAELRSAWTDECVRPYASRADFGW